MAEADESPSWYRQLSPGAQRSRADDTGLRFVSEGSVLTMYLASGKRKHDRYFWVDTRCGILYWDKKKRKTERPAKSANVTAVRNAPRVRTAREWFDFVDVDRSGALEQSELSSLYKQAHGKKLSKKELRAAMAAMDKNGSGSIEFDEFENWWSSNGGDLERYREMALTILAGDVTLLLIARTVAIKERWIVGLSAVLRKLGRLPLLDESAPTADADALFQAHAEQGASNVPDVGGMASRPGPEPEESTSDVPAVTRIPSPPGLASRLADQKAGEQILRLQVAKLQASLVESERKRTALEALLDERTAELQASLAESEKKRAALETLLDEYTATVKNAKQLLGEEIPSPSHASPEFDLARSAGNTPETQKDYAGSSLTPTWNAGGGESSNGLAEVNRHKDLGLEQAAESASPSARYIKLVQSSEPLIPSYHDADSSHEGMSSDALDNSSESSMSALSNAEDSELPYWASPDWPTIRGGSEEPQLEPQDGPCMSSKTSKGGSADAMAPHSEGDAAIEEQPLPLSPPPSQTHWTCSCGFQFNTVDSESCVACDTCRLVAQSVPGNETGRGSAEVASSQDRSDEESSLVEAMATASGEEPKRVEKVVKRPYNEWDKWCASAILPVVRAAMPAQKSLSSVYCAANPTVLTLLTLCAAKRDELDKALTKEIEEDEKGDKATTAAPAAPEGPEPEFALTEAEFQGGGDWKDICGDGSIFKKIIKHGDAASDKPTLGAGVKCHYVGRLLDGTKFDSSRDRSAPFEFKAGSGVIQGWSDGIVTMEVGETASFAILPHKAYGTSGSPPKIPPDSTLQFEIELLSWADMEDVVGTGGKVQTKVLKAGAPPPGPPGPGQPDGKPKMHAICQLMLELSTKASGVIVAQTDTPVEHRIGGGTLPRGVEAALLQMREGAQCELRVAPDWASVRHTEKNAKKKYPAGWLLDSYKGSDLAAVKSLAAEHVSGKMHGGGYTHVSQENLLVKLELVSFIEVIDASKDGGVLLDMQSEGEGYEKPSMYDFCKVKFSLRDEVEEPEAITKYPSGYLDEYKGCDLEAIKEQAGVFESSGGEVPMELGSGNMCVGLELALMEMKRGAKARLRIHPAYSRYTPVGDVPVFREDKPAREVTVLGEVELISWVKVEDLSEDKKGGLLLRMLEEGGQGPDGYKKPKDLSTCCVQYKIVAANDGMVFKETLRVEYSPGYLDAYKGLTLEDIKAKAGPGQYIVDEGAQPVPGMDEALKKMKRGGKVELRVSREALSDSDLFPSGSQPVDLLVTIELVHFENLKESWELKGAAKLTHCETLKEKGNTVFKAAEYERALRRYTTAKSLADSNHDMSDEDKVTASALKLSLLNNLATVCAKLGKLDDVKKHCDDALKIDEKNFKALMRRGMTHIDLKDFDAGETDYKAAAAIQPDSPTLKRSMNALKKIRKKQLVEDKKVAEKMMAASTKKSVHKGLTKSERKAAEEYDAKNNTAAAQRVGEETRIAQAVEFLLQPRVAFAPRETKISYLQQQCKLTASDLDAAFVAAYDAAAKEAELKRARAKATERAAAAAVESAPAGA